MKDVDNHNKITDSTYVYEMKNRDINEVNTCINLVKNLYNDRKSFAYINLFNIIEDTKHRIHVIAENNNLLPSRNFFSSLITNVRNFFSRHFFQCELSIQNRHLQSLITQVESVIQHIFSYLKIHKIDLQAEKKWLELGFPSEIIQIAPQFITTMYQSGLLFGMKAFSKRQQGQLGIYKNEEGTFQVLFEGNPISLEDMQKNVYFDDSTKYAMYKENGGEARPLRYVSPPIGFSRVDRSLVRGVRADTLSTTEFTLLKEHAAKFKKNIEPQSVRAVIQICTRLGRGNGLDLPDFFYEDGNEENIPPHYFFRIIDCDGNVYAKGVGPRKAPSLTNFASIIPGYLDDIDYMEFRTNPLTVTSIPITDETKLDEIFNHLHSRPQVFSFPRYNCTTVVKEILEKIGVEVDLETSIEDFIFSGLRNPFSKIPIVGPVVGTISKVFQFVQEGWIKYVPPTVKKFFSPITATASWLISCIATIARSVLSLSLGGTTVHPLALEELRRKGKDPSSIQCVSSWKNLVYPEHQRFHSGLNVLKWQKNQSTTEKISTSSKEPEFQILNSFKDLV